MPGCLSRVQLFDRRRLCKAPGERVLAGARPDDQNVHAGECSEAVCEPGAAQGRPASVR